MGKLVGKTNYGNIHLTPERYQEFLCIVNKHTTNLMLELKEHEIIPVCIALQPTSVFELKEINKINQQD
ncbi:MAG: hypothetical protein K2H20_00285 [Bacilli bacterium]|nr:hypothetical protein [Bacilli bacterium]